MDQPAVAGNPQCTIEHDAHRRARFHSGQTAGQYGIIGQHRTDADQNGVALRAQQMDAGLRYLACDRHRRAAGERDLVIGRDGELEQHVWTLFAHAQEMPGVITRGLLGTQTDINLNAGGL